MEEISHAEESPANMPRVTPYLYYEDVKGALEWLTRAFGLTETVRMPDRSGNIAHAEMRLAEGVVMMGCPGPEYRSPRKLGQTTFGVHVYVDDVDATSARPGKWGPRSCESRRTSSMGIVATVPRIWRDTAGTSPSTSVM